MRRAGVPLGDGLHFPCLVRIIKLMNREIHMLKFDWQLYAISMLLVNNHRLMQTDIGSVML